MNRRTLAFLFLTLLAASPLSAAAQEGGTSANAQNPDNWRTEVEARYKQMAEQLTQPNPKRDIKIVAGESQKMSQDGTDPRLQENKFVAVFQFRPSGLNAKDESSAAQFYSRQQLDAQNWQNYPESLSSLLKIDGARLMQGEWQGFDRSRGSRQGGMRRPQEPIHLRFDQLAKLSSEAFHPDADVLTILVSEENNPAVFQFLSNQQYKISNDGGTSLYVQFGYSVFAPTATEAEERARAIIQLYDGGLSRPMQQYLFEQGAKRLQLAAPEHDKVKQLEDQRKGEREKLAKPSEISPDILSQLKAQKVMVAVELAGLSARVKACDAMLGEPRKLELSTLQSISDMKVKAEIERVGIKEKLDQINNFIAEGDTREKARKRMAALANEMSEVRQKILNYERSAWQYASLFDLYAPFAVVDNQITISPVEWTQQ